MLPELAAGVPEQSPFVNHSTVTLPLAAGDPDCPRTVTRSCTVAPAATVVTTWCWASWMSVVVCEPSFETGGDGAEKLTVAVSRFDSTSPTTAVATFVTLPALTSAAVTVYAAVQIRVSPGSRKLSWLPIVVSVGHVTVALLSETVTGPDSRAL